MSPEFYMSENIAHFIEIILIGISLAMDALAVSVALSAIEKKNFSGVKIFETSFVFGFFQFFMPVLGWICGAALSGVFLACGRYVAGILLVCIGGKMIFSKQEENAITKFSFRMLFVLGVATSIDALIVGIGFGCLQYAFFNMLVSAIVIGVVTALISVLGCFIGKFYGHILGNRCEVFGGIVLVLLAVKTMFHFF